VTLKAMALDPKERYQMFSVVSREISVGFNEARAGLF
jgi:hypothetical protein